MGPTLSGAEFVEECMHCGNAGLLCASPLKNVFGQCLLTSTAPTVWPISTLGAPAVAEAVARSATKITTPFSTLRNRATHANLARRRSTDRQGPDLGHHRRIARDPQSLGGNLQPPQPLML